MTYLIGSHWQGTAAGTRFRELLGRSEILQMPGAYNGLASLQARAAGFEAVYLSGAAMSASMGLPDLGIITVDEVCFFIRQVCRSAGLPVLVDGDTGYGEALNVMHMVRSFEDGGAAAVHIEDQLLPKKRAKASMARSRARCITSTPERMPSFRRRCTTARCSASSLGEYRRPCSRT
jgi:methylisocitrate lyase